MRLPFVRTLAGSAAPTPPTTDPNFENVTLLLHGDGTNGGQNNTFVDGSANNFAITRNGNTTQGTFSPYGDRWSNYFDGTGDYLSIPDNAAFDFGTGDFTIECWAYISGSASLDNGGNRVAGIFSGYTTTGTSTSSYTFEILGNATTTGTGLGFYNNVSNVQTSVVATTTIAQHTWHHIAVARSGTTTRLFLNGVVVASGTLGNQNVNTDYTINIGRLGLAGYLQEFNGYISNLRVLKGTALYTGSYTVPTAPLTAIANTSLLTCQSNRFRDASANNFTITRNGDVSVQRFSPFHPTAAYSAGTIGGSGYFDGSGDYLVVPSGAFSYTSGTAYTFECWIYPTSYPIQYPTILTANVSSGSNTVSMYIENNGSCGFGQANVGTVVVAPAGSIRLGCWNHIAVGKNSSNSVRMWVNGVSVATGTDTNNYAVGAVRVCLNGANANPFAGYIGDFRSVAGSDVYGYSNTTITVPTAPLSSVANTQLLLAFQNAAILDNAMMVVPETVGNAQISTTVKQYGTGSLYFDGTGDYLKFPASNILEMGTGDFTVEFWVYIAARTSFGGVVLSGLGANDLYVNFDTGGNVLRLTNSTTVFAVTGTIPLTTWTHIAVVRSSGSSKIYVNGTGGTAVTCTINFTATGPSIGAANTGASPFNGYIDDLRITKGVARYTANFTPPTAALPDL